ncbi:MAG: SCO family protein [Crocinitomicaceae bacterium]|nr:SCO family protein [Crocinitomicaceae bacterium]
MKIGSLFVFAFLIFIASCSPESSKEENAKSAKTEHKEKKEDRLPILGHRELENGDTVYHTIPDFIFTNQTDALIKTEDLDGKIIIANFFFSSCPSICPIMTKQMKRLQGMLAVDSNEVVFLSHTIDPKNDDVARLKAFAEHYGANEYNWHFLRGEMDYLYEIAKEGYLSSALVDDQEPGGFLHSPYFVLVDKERRIRGMYDGTIPEEVDQLASDFQKLKKEYASK